MNEQTVARLAGSDGARAGWPGAADRVDAPRPDAVRSEAAQATRPLPGSPRPVDLPVDAENSSPAQDPVREPTPDASFPTSYARFEINAKTQRLSIKIVDAATDEVIREIPNEQVQRIAEDLQSLARRTSIGKRPSGGAGAEGGGVDRYV